MTVQQTGIKIRREKKEAIETKTHVHVLMGILVFLMH